MFFKKHRYLFSFLLILLCACQEDPVFVQSHRVPALQRYVPDFGWSDNSGEQIGQKCMLFDRRGNLWIGTSEGLCLFDTKHPRFFSYAEGLEGTVLTMFEDRSGNIWFGTHTGISRLNANQASNPCITSTCKHQLSVIRDVEAHNLELSKCFNNFIHTDRAVISIEEGKTGALGQPEIWFGTAGGGLLHYDGSRADHPCLLKTCAHDLRAMVEPEHQLELFKCISKEAGSPDSFVYSMAKDKHGNLWLGTSSGTSGYNGKFITGLGALSALSKKSIVCITEDWQGSLWFGTSGSGAFQFDGKTLKNFNKKNGLGSDHIFCMSEDKDGKLWIGTSSGLCYYDNDKFEIVKGTEDHFVYGVAPGKNKDFWFYTSGNTLFKYDLDQMRGKSNLECLGSIDPNGTSGMKDVRCMLRDREGDLWFGTNENGVYRYSAYDLAKSKNKIDPGRLVCLSTREGFCGNSIRAMLQDKLGNIWFCTNNGVCCYDKNAGSWLNLSSIDGLNCNNVWSVLEDRAGCLWFGTAEGFCYLNRGQGRENARFLNKIKKLGSFFTRFQIPVESLIASDLTNVCPLPSLVTCMIEDKSGNLWLGTYGGGLYRYAKEEDKDLCSQDQSLDPLVSEQAFKKAYTRFTVDEGLASNFVQCMQQDEKGNIWLGTACGLVSYNVDENPCVQNTCKHHLNNSPDKKAHKTQLRKTFKSYKVFGQKDIWAILPCKSQTSAKDRIYLATYKDGLYRYDYFEGQDKLIRISSDYVESVMSDEKGKLWLGTANGVLCSDQLLADTR